MRAVATSASAGATSAAGRASALDWLSITRPRIGGMVYFAALTGGLLAEAGARAFEAAAWVACAGAAASIFNQVLERSTDRLMARTAARPLATGRLRPRDALLLGALLAAGSTAALALRFNLLAALLSLSTLCAYALVYTPLKRLSTANTAVGAIPGAMPPLIGFVAVAGGTSAWAWSLYAVLFAWQFPHFMAIGWLYREDYARAGMRTLPALPGTEGLAGLHALGYSLALVAVSLVPWARGQAGPVYAASALVLGLAYAGCSARFARREDERGARAVLLCSLVYLPLLYSSVLLDPAVRRACLPAILP